MFGNTHVSLRLFAFFCGVLLAPSFMPTPVFAGDVLPSQSSQLDAERQRLAFLVGELDQLIAQVNDDAKQSKRVGRITFQYDALASDLGQVRAAIQHHVNDTALLPRPVAPLNLNYSR